MRDLQPIARIWALCVLYKTYVVGKPVYSGCLMVRRDGKLGYAVDILELHNPTHVDNLGKA